MTDVELARAIHELQRRSAVRRRRGDRGPVPTWEQLTPSEQARKVGYARRLGRVYETARSNASESPISACRDPAPLRRLPCEL